MSLAFGRGPATDPRSRLRSGSQALVFTLDRANSMSHLAGDASIFDLGLFEARVFESSPRQLSGQAFVYCTTLSCLQAVKIERTI